MLAVLESLLGFFQVVRQGALGLYWLGEPHLNLLDATIAKTIVSGGGRLLRAYGTFPHPNVLAAFLLVGLIVLLSSRAPLFSRKERGVAISSSVKKIASLAFGELAMTTGLFIIILGLTLTFSRFAWLVGGLIFLFWVFCHRHFKLSAIIIVIIIVIVSIFSWAVFPKLTIRADEPAIVLRSKYLKIGWGILKEKLLLGTGIGNQVDYAIKNNLYQKEGIIKKLDYQPVHNIYLLIADELGVVGLILFLLLIFLTLKKTFPSCTIAQEGTVGLEFVSLIWLSLLLLGLTDHYLWDLADGQVMFWTVVFLSINNSSRS